MALVSCNHKNNGGGVKKESSLNQGDYTKQINFVGHWLGEGMREDFVRNFARSYEFENQDVKVNLVFPEDIYFDREDRASNEKYIAKVITKGITDWDILKLNGEYREVIQYVNDPDWAKKYLVDFSKNEAFLKGINKDLKNQKTRGSWGGMIPGPYLEGQYWALWCNKRVAEKMGIELKQTGMTFDDFEEMLRKSYEYTTAHPEDSIYTIFEAKDWSTTMAIAFQLYSSLVASPEEFNLNEVTPGRLKAWEKTLHGLEKLSKYKPVSPLRNEVYWDQTTADFLDGKYLFYVNGSWMYNIWEGIDSEKVLDCVPCEFPTMGEPTVYPATYLVTWGIPKQAPNKEEAKKFLMAMNKPNVAEQWSRYTKCPTGIKGNLSNAALGGDQFEMFSRHIQKKYGSDIYRYYESQHWVLSHNSNSSLFYNEVFNGEMSASDAMKYIRQNLGL